MAVISPSSVRMSWEGIQLTRITDFEFQGYTVYYRLKTSEEESEEEFQSFIVPITDNSVVIKDLAGSSVYQFRVAPILAIDGKITAGVESDLVEADTSVCKLLHKAVMLSLIFCFMFVGNQFTRKIREPKSE